MSLAALETAAKIDRLKELPADWDSYGADGITPSTLEHAKQVVDVIAGKLGHQFMSPVVGPTPDGGVALIWRRTGRPKLELFIPPHGPARYVLLQGRRLLEKGPLTDIQILLTYASE